MGWRLRVDFERDGAIMLDQMTTRPVELFSKPYLGHILFLLSGKEKELVKRLAKQMVELDAATGTALAFVVVSAETRLAVKMPDSRKPDREKKEFPIELVKLDNGYMGRFRALESLIRSGKLGTVFTDDELVAMNYAAYEIGRHLGVSGKIPCVVVFDGLSDGEFDAIPLTDTVIDGMVDICRRFTDSALPRGEFSLFKEKQKSLIEKVQSAKRYEDWREEVEVSTAEFRGNLERLRNHIDDLQGKLRELMLSGARKASFVKSFEGFKNALSSSKAILRPSSSRWQVYLDDYQAEVLASHAEVARLHKTVLAVESSLQEGLDDKALAERFDGITGHIAKISPSLLPNTPVTSQRVGKRILDDVKKLQAARIEEILQIHERLDGLSDLHAKIKEETDHWYERAFHSRDDELEKADTVIRQELEEFRQFSQVSFRHFFRTEARRLGWKSQAGAVSRSLWKGYFKHWLKPENISKAVKAWVEAS